MKYFDKELTNLHLMHLMTTEKNPAVSNVNLELKNCVLLFLYQIGCKMFVIICIVLWQLLQLWIHAPI